MLALLGWQLGHGPALQAWPSILSIKELTMIYAHTDMYHMLIAASSQYSSPITLYGLHICLQPFTAWRPFVTQLPAVYLASSSSSS